MWTFRNDEGDMIRLIPLYVDGVLIVCAPRSSGKTEPTLLKKIRDLYAWGAWGSKVFTQRGAKIVQVYDQHLKQ